MYLLIEQLKVKKKQKQQQLTIKSFFLKIIKVIGPPEQFHYTLTAPACLQRCTREETPS